MQREATADTERVLNVQDIDPQYRHRVIFQLFEHLQPGEGFQIVNDHDPMPLHRQFAMRYGSVFAWRYLERGPDHFRVRISRA